MLQLNSSLEGFANIIFRLPGRVGWCFQQEGAGATQRIKGCLVVLSSRVTTFTCPRGSQALGLFAGNNLLAVGISSEPGCFFLAIKKLQ